MGENREAGEPRKNSVKSQYKTGRGRKRRGGRKREEERTPGAASQVDRVAAGESSRSGPCGAATSLSSPCLPVMGELEMLLLRRGCSAGFRLRRASLLEKLLQVFFPLLFSSRLFFFFPSLFLRGSPASRSSPDPPASPFSSSPTS